MDYYYLGRRTDFTIKNFFKRSKEFIFGAFLNYIPMKYKRKTHFGQLFKVAFVLLQCGPLWVGANNRYQLVKSLSELNDSSIILIVFEANDSYFALGKASSNKAVDVTLSMDESGDINLARVDSTGTPWTTFLQIEENGWLLRRKNKIGGEYEYYLNNREGKSVTNSSIQQIWNLDIDNGIAVITNSKKRLSIVGNAISGFTYNAESESECTFLIYKYIPPLVIPVPDIVQTDKEITISARQDCEIFFTIDGTKPTLFSEKYNEPLILYGGTMLVRAIAVYPDGNISGESTLSASLQPLESGFYVMATLLDSCFLAAGQTRSSKNYYNHDSIVIAYDKAIVNRSEFIYYLQCNTADNDSIITYQLFHYDREVGLRASKNQSSTLTPGVPDTLYWSKEKSCFYTDASDNIRYYSFYKNSDRFGFYKSNLKSITLFPAAYKLSVTEMGYSTLYLDYPVEIPEEVNAYVAPYMPENGMIRFAKINDVVIPQNTGVLIENSGEFIFNHTETITNELDYCENYLLGSSVRDSIFEPNASCYALNDTILFTGEVQACFKAMESKFACKANKAYLKLPGKVLVKGFALTDNIQSLVEVMKFDKACKDDIFDLRGIKVNTPAPGIYIQNGKKIIIR